jgi:hypothetical protein
MCLFLTIAPCDSDFNRTVVRRILKGASLLSAFPEELDGRSVYFLANSPNCACDLQAAERGTDASGTHLSLAAVDAIERVARASVAAARRSSSALSGPASTQPKSSTWTLKVS